MILFKTELKKVLHSYQWRFAVSVGICIAVLQVFWFYKNVYLINEGELAYLMKDLQDNGKSIEWFEIGVLQGWLGCECYSPYNQLYFLILPLLAAIPCGSSLYDEWESGYVGLIVTRCGRKKYFVAKLSTAFLTGGLVVCIPLMLNFVMSACYLPVIGTDPIALQDIVRNCDMGADFYYNQPLMYVIMYICIDFFIGGINATVSLAVTHFFANRFLVILFPILLNFCIDYGLDNLFTGIKGYNLYDIMNPSQKSGSNTYSSLLASLGICMLISVVIYIVSNYKKDCLKEEPL